MKRTLLGIACVASLAACSGGSTSGAGRKVSDTWPAKWCRAEPGVTKQDLVAIMGQPTGASAEHMSWSANQYQFNAFLDPDGTVRQLDINDHSLSDAEKAALKCAKVRVRRHD